MMQLWIVHYTDSDGVDIASIEAGDAPDPSLWFDMMGWNCQTPAGTYPAYWVRGTELFCVHGVFSVPQQEEE